jgi:hypothetical protein
MSVMTLRLCASYQRPDQRLLVIPHDDPGVGAANEVPPISGFLVVRDHHAPPLLRRPVDFIGFSVAIPFAWWYAIV